MPLAFFGSWLHHCDVCLCLHTAVLSFPCVFSCLSLLRTSAIGFRAHLGNPGWSHLTILSCICKDFPPPNKVTFIGSVAWVCLLERSPICPLRCLNLTLCRALGIYFLEIIVLGMKLDLYILDLSSLENLHKSLLLGKFFESLWNAVQQA